MSIEQASIPSTPYYLAQLSCRCPGTRGVCMYVRPSTLALGLVGNSRPGGPCMYVLRYSIENLVVSWVGRRCRGSVQGGACDEPGPVRRNQTVHQCDDDLPCVHMYRYLSCPSHPPGFWMPGRCSVRIYGEQESRRFWRGAWMGLGRCKGRPRACRDTKIQVGPPHPIYIYIQRDARRPPPPIGPGRRDD